MRAEKEKKKEHGKIKGYYHCHSCGKFYPTNGTENLCTYCGISQINLQAWQNVIKRRQKYMLFAEGKISSTEEEEAAKKLLEIEQRQKENVYHEKTSHKADLIGKKHTRFKLLALCVGFLWMLGIGGILYKAYSKKEKKNKEQAEAIAKKEAKNKAANILSPKEKAKIAKQCYNTARRFFYSQDYELRASLVDGNKLNEMLAFYQNQKSDHNVKIKGFYSYQVEQNYAEIVILLESGQKLELAFVNSDNNWLIDWDFLTTKSAMPFNEYLETKPEGAFEFRLLFSEKEEANNYILSLYGYTRNSSQFTELTGARQTLIIKNKEQADLLRDFTTASKKYARFNDTLSESDSGAFGADDPRGFHRIRLTLEYKTVENEKILTIHKIHACHWLGEYYKPLYKPAFYRLMPSLKQ